MINSFVDRVFFTDGACSGNPGPGAYAIIELDNETDKTILNGRIELSEWTTNNREELKGIIYVLKTFASEDYKIAIYSDSAYCVNLFNDWIWKWSVNDWRNSKGKQVENLDLIQEGFELYKYYESNVTIIKVKGHDGLIGNELVDAMASGNKTKYITLCRKNNISDFEIYHK